MVSKPASVPLSIKLKWDRYCVLLLLKPSCTVKEVQKQLAATLEATQLLYLTSEGDGEEEEDIPIPVPTHGQLDSDSEDQPSKKMETDGSDEKTVISPEDIRIGLPNNKEMTSFKDITGEKDTLDALGLKDQSTLAFVVGDGEKFSVEVPQFEAE